MQKQAGHGRFLSLMVGALGVVFGDIGTSPLYAFKECFNHELGFRPEPEMVFGVLSLIFWALTISISIKYVSMIMRADNKGEGGILALNALLGTRLLRRHQFLSRAPLLMLGIFGAALLYGDGVITPAISVLSAVEGLQIASPQFRHWIVPLTVLILVGIFSVQKRGTGKLGAWFGPLTLLWFISIAACAIPWIIKKPEVLMAINPVYGILFFIENSWKGFWVLSAVVLVITGGEALYADMGHFGKKPIRAAWFWFVGPALIINYMGQAAYVLSTGPAALVNPFYGMVPEKFLLPMIVLATLATIIASQALISGCFSLTQQAVQLGYLPRIRIIHTNAEEKGQIYVPLVNHMLMAICVLLVFSFQRSTNIAAAYGIAVTATMTITTCLFAGVARWMWKWSLPKTLALVSLFLAIDVSFLIANFPKFSSGGWVPVVLALVIFITMLTWQQGRKILSKLMLNKAIPLEEFFELIQSQKAPRVGGTAVFMTLNQDIAPAVLLTHFKHNQVLHEKVILLSVITQPYPEVPSRERIRVQKLDFGFVKVSAHYGYMQNPNIYEVLGRLQEYGHPIDLERLSFYLGRESLVVTGTSAMLKGQKKLFAFLSRNARPATEFFGIPPERVIEIGTQIEI